MNFVKFVSLLFVSTIVFVACGENGRSVKVGNNPLHEEEQTRKVVVATGLKPIKESEIEGRILSKHLSHAELMFALSIANADDEIAALDPTKCMGQSTNKLVAKDLNVATDISLEELESFSLNYQKLLKAKKIETEEKKNEVKQDNPEEGIEPPVSADLTIKEQPSDDKTAEEIANEKKAAAVAPNLKVLTYFEYVAMQECKVTLSKSLEQKISYSGLVGEFEFNGARLIYVESTPARVDKNFVLLQKYFENDARDQSQSIPIVLNKDAGPSVTLQDLIILEAEELVKPSKR